VIAEPEPSNGDLVWLLIIGLMIILTVVLVYPALGPV
jgi:hypothetical protein